MHLITPGNIIGAVFVIGYLGLFGLVVREVLRINKNDRRGGIPDPTRGYYDED